MELAPVFVAAYLIGSIPFGLILTRAAGLGDIRAIGSGNIGATNVLRTGNKKLAALTLFLDGFKGFLAVKLALHFAALTHDTDLTGACAGLAALLGHMFPVWLKFKGGKGVATALGVAIGLSPFIGVAVCLTWLITAVMFRYSSLAALVAMATLPGFAWYLGHNQLVVPLTLVTVLVWLRHYENVRRLMNGTESKIGQKK